MVMELKQTQRILMINFWLILIVTFFLVVLYESEILLPTAIGMDEQVIFVWQVFLEMFTIVFIPLSLKLFSFKRIRRKLLQGKAASLLPWGTARINMLCVPMLVNTIMYYQTLSPAFGYMAIILLLCLFFIYPSMSRCYAETENLQDKR